MSLPGVLFVRGLQRDFEDLLAVLIFSPVGGNRRLPTDRKGSGHGPLVTRRKLEFINGFWGTDGK